MKRFFLLRGLLLLLGISVFPAYAQNKCDRKCLVTLMDRYLAALVQHNPNSVPVAKDVILVENTEKIAIGKGLWETASAGPTKFKIYAADPVAGQVGFMGIIKEKNKPVILGARLKVVDGKITEIDHLVVRDNKEPLSANLIDPRPGFLTPVKPSERTPREQMLKIAYSYYDSIVNNNGKLAPFAGECQRRENGDPSVNVSQTPEEAKKDNFSVFRRMKCSEQMDTGIWSYITHINQRRLIAADEEMGLVFAFSMFVHDGVPKVMKIKGVPGVTEYPNKYGAFNLPAAHMFRIRNGRLYEIEAIGYMAKHGIKNGWE
jgi:hypothetical protein